MERRIGRKVGELTDKKTLASYAIDGRIVLSECMLLEAIIICNLEAIVSNCKR